MWTVEVVLTPCVNDDFPVVVTGFRQPLENPQRPNLKSKRIKTYLVKYHKY